MATTAEERRIKLRREADDLPATCQNAISDGVAEGVAAGVVKGFKELIEDKDFCAAFWESGFKELSVHTQNGASQWVGKRIMTWLTTAGLVLCLGWLVKSGSLK